MTEAPVIFDRKLVTQRQKRALAQGPADFLLAAAVEELAARLSAVQREFSHALDLGGPTPMLAEALARPGLEIVRIVEDRAFAGAGRCVVADTEAVPVAPASVDLVVSALDLQWVNDLPGRLAQVRRAR